MCKDVYRSKCLNICVGRIIREETEIISLIPGTWFKVMGHQDLRDWENRRVRWLRTLKGRVGRLSNRLGTLPHLLETAISGMSVFKIIEYMPGKKKLVVFVFLNKGQKYQRLLNQTV